MKEDITMLIFEMDLENVMFSALKQQTVFECTSVMASNQELSLVTCDSRSCVVTFGSIAAA